MSRFNNWVKGNLVPAIATAVPVSAWHSWCGAPLLLPYYHMVSDAAVPHVRPLYPFRSVAQFNHELEFLLRHYQPITLADLLQCVRDRGRFRHSFLLSFDDGFREMADIVAPILKAKGLSAVFFLNSAFVDNHALCFQQKIALVVDFLEQKIALALEAEIAQILDEHQVKPGPMPGRLRSVRYANRHVMDLIALRCGLDFSNYLAAHQPYLSSEQIRQMVRDGFAFGGHSHDHPFYGDLPLMEQLRQTRESIEFLTQRFNLDYRVFAFPHSDEGMAQSFFGQAAATGFLEASFGTGGLLKDVWPTHFQRFSMEKSPIAPRVALTRQYLRRAVKTVARTAVRTHP